MEERRSGSAVDEGVIEGERQHHLIPCGDGAALVDHRYPADRSHSEYRHLR